MYTYQDFHTDVGLGLPEAVMCAVNAWKTSETYKTALVAGNYDRQHNDTIMRFARMLYSADGRRTVDPLASNHRLCSNFFRRLNVQRTTYSLGNGISFDQTFEGTKERLGGDIDTVLHTAGYDACIHGVSFLFYNNGTVAEFKATEFAPLLDERTGDLVAGVRFWQIDASKPLTAILYEADGYTRFEATDGKQLKLVDKKRAYIETHTTTDADAAAGLAPTVTGRNYGRLPIVPLYGSRLRQSTLVGMRSKIDAYDLIQSGFANDLTDCSEIYWIIGGAGGMGDKDLARFRDRLKLNHIASVPNADDVTVTPYTQEIPYQARKEMLDNLKASIYEDFGGLDVHTVAAGATNDHIDAAYQPLDENADDFEYQVIVAVQQLLRISGMTGEIPVPTFKRNRISNQMEYSQMVMMFAPYLSGDMIRAKAPFLSADEVKAENEIAGDVEDLHVGGLFGGNQAGAGSE